MATTVTEHTKKTIHIEIPALGEIRDLSIPPGSTVQKVLENAGLSGYRLALGPALPLPGSSDDVYAAVPDGAEIFAFLVVRAC
ncbi:MAG: hypothetical protein ACREKS_00200 [Candidatus Rokuibacteriota bacterium]